MAVTEKTQVDFTITVQPNGIILIRKERVILDDDQEINRLFSRITLEPGQDVSNQPIKIKQLTQIFWTPQVIADYQAAKNANQPK